MTNQSTEKSFPAVKPARGPRLLSCLSLLTLGLVLIVWGLVRSTAVGQPDDSTDPSQAAEKTTAISEAQLIKEITIGGVARDKSGKIKKTYGEGEKPAQACPT